MVETKPKIIVILGPTASGKSDCAVEIARRFNGEIVSADSRQVYRGLDIGSCKITKKEMRGIPHHLLGVANPRQRFSVSEYQKLANRVIKDIVRRGKLPIICGGTGYYIQSIVENIVYPVVPPNETLRKKLSSKNTDELFVMLSELDSRRARAIDAKNKARLIRAIEIATTLGYVPHLETKRPSWDILQIGITFPLKILEERIKIRLEKRLRKGMIAEAKRLHQQGLSWKRMRALGLDYGALADFLTGIISREKMKSRIVLESVQYAKRQMTWFKRNKKIIWLTPQKQAVQPRDLLNLKTAKAIERFLPHRKNPVHITTF